MSLVDTAPVRVECPYCGEPLDILVDPADSARESVREYIEDCQVCCRPITMRIQIEEEEYRVEALHEDEY